MALKDLDVEAVRLRQRYIDEQIVTLDEAASVLESPLERAFFWAMCRVVGGAYNHGLLSSMGWPKGVGKAPLVVLVSFEPPIYWVEMSPQVQVETEGNSYRLDFALKVKSPLTGTRVFVDIELDGHEFHERTKEQAERDKTRDRHLQMAGYGVARFTGSQVYRDPDGVAHEAFGFATALLFKAEG